MVHAPTAEEKNAEAAKTFKVNCDQRNVSSVDTLAVNVLNASQVTRLSCALWNTFQ